MSAPCQQTPALHYRRVTTITSGRKAAVTTGATAGACSPQRKAVTWIVSQDHDGSAVAAGARHATPATTKIAAASQPAAAAAAAAAARRGHPCCRGSAILTTCVNAALRTRSVAAAPTAKAERARVGATGTALSRLLQTGLKSPTRAARRASSATLTVAVNQSHEIVLASAHTMATPAAPRNHLFRVVPGASERVPTMQHKPCEYVLL